MTTKIKMMEQLHGTPVGVKEIADMLGVSKHTAMKWQQRGRLPMPVKGWSVSGQAAWRRLDIIKWALETNRLADRDYPSLNLELITKWQAGHHG